MSNQTIYKINNQKIRQSDIFKINTIYIFRHKISLSQINKSLNQLIWSFCKILTVFGQRV